MSPISRILLTGLLANDHELTSVERLTVQRLATGNLQNFSPDQLLLVSQKTAARALDVNRDTIWRMIREKILKPVEILPACWRYPYAELAALAERKTSLKRDNEAGASSL